MSSLVVPSVDAQSDSQIRLTPKWGAWSACLIVGCFYLTQALGMMLTRFTVGIGVGFVESSTGDHQGILAQSVLVWLLPFSLLVGTVLGTVISLKVATRRAQSTLDQDWLSKLARRTMWRKPVGESASRWKRGNLSQ